VSRGDYWLLAAVALVLGIVIGVVLSAWVGAWLTLFCHRGMIL